MGGKDSEVMLVFSFFTYPCLSNWAKVSMITCSKAVIDLDFAVIDLNLAVIELDFAAFSFGFIIQNDCLAMILMAVKY